MKLLANKQLEQCFANLVYIPPTNSKTTDTSCPLTHTVWPPEATAFHHNRVFHLFTQTHNSTTVSFGLSIPSSQSTCIRDLISKSLRDDEWKTQGQLPISVMTIHGSVLIIPLSFYLLFVLVFIVCVYECFLLFLFFPPKVLKRKTLIAVLIIIDSNLKIPVWMIDG